MKYSIEVLDETTKLVSIIQEQLDCSFDEACETTKIIFRKLNNKEIEVDNSLKSLLPDFLEQFRRQKYEGRRHLWNPRLKTWD